MMKTQYERVSPLFWKKPGTKYTSSNGTDAIKIVQKRKIDLVITDLKMQGMDGIGVLEEVKKIRPETLVVIITAFASLESAIASIRKGAFDYLVKPFQVDALKLVVRRSLEMKRLTESNTNLLKNMKKKNAELKKRNIELCNMQEKLLEAERLSAITETIVALHHEINNPLTVILGKVQILHDRYCETDVLLGGDLKILENLTLKVAAIIDKLKSVSRPIRTKYIDQVSMLDIKESK